MHPYAPFMFGRAGMMIGGLFLLLIALAVIAAIVVAIVLLVRHSKRHNNSNISNYNNPKASVYHALAILDERYAKGELTDEEYEQKKTALKKE